MSKHDQSFLSEEPQELKQKKYRVLLVLRVAVAGVAAGLVQLRVRAAKGDVLGVEGRAGVVGARRPGAGADRGEGLPRVAGHARRRRRYLSHLTAHLLRTLVRVRRQTHKLRVLERRMAG